MKRISQDFYDEVNQSEKQIEDRHYLHLLRKTTVHVILLLNGDWITDVFLVSLAYRLIQDCASNHYQHRLEQVKEKNNIKVECK